MPDDARVKSLKDKVSKEEWQLRVDLAACYRLIALYGWDDLVFTHVSARIPGPEHHFLINPYGMMFDEITASSLVKVDAKCNKLSESPFPVNPAGFVIHSAVHGAREDAQCVAHVHTVAGIAVSAQKAGVLPISQQSTLVLASLGYHDYEGIALLDDEKPRLVRDLGSNMFLMLRNHGLLTVGSTIADAFLLMFNFQRTCEIQVAALAGNGQSNEARDELISIDPQIVAGVKQAVAGVTKGMMGGLAWPGLLRKLDRESPGYK